MIEKPTVTVDWKGTVLAGQLECPCGAVTEIRDIFQSNVICSVCDEKYDLPNPIVCESHQ